VEEVCQNARQKATSRKQYPRKEVIGQVISFEAAKEKLGISQREYARINGIPHTTFQQWIANKASINAPQALVALVESPEGLAFLHQLVMAALFVITQLAPGSIRMACTFLVLSGLNEFVASSYGSVQKVVKAMEEQIVLFGRCELERLGKLMRPKKITIIEDETFHPQICLVAMDGASGFIFLEMYAQSRDSATWAKALKEALGDLPVEVVQVTSDEAKALLRHAEVELEANHSPDLFHVVHELFKGTALSMAREVKAAGEGVDEARKAKERLEASMKISMESSASWPPNGSLEAMQKNIDEAKAEEELAQESLDAAEQQQKEMADAIRGITECYHPFDLETGEVRSAETVAADIEGKFAIIDELAEKVSLCDSALERIDKARRVVTAMVATITFFHETTRAWIEQLFLPEQIEQFIMERWIPARYLELVAERASDSETRARLRQSAAKLMPSPQEIGAMIFSLCDNDRLLVVYAVEQCAQLFQRSSSAVEGRNGHLSLFHHGHHRLTETKLEARTVIHNFMKVRPDETTAAERFFGHAPRDLFEWLIERMDSPKRPARKLAKLAS
jgi:hypothetical protein